MKKLLVTLSVLAVLGGAGGFLFAWSGLYNVGARKEHWSVTEWFLRFGLRSSVRTHALPVDAPPLDEVAMIYRGLGHYEGACAPCHGTPGKAGNPIIKHMLPVPPHLPEQIGDWTDAQLFWIVKNGLKYTGMPAWPAEDRDDEVWSVVAFLRRMPDMPVEEYRRVARNDTIHDPEAVEENAGLIAAAGPVGTDLLACARCHGLRGEGGGAGAFPRLAGQKPEYFLQTMKEYAAGSRPSGIMHPIAAELDEEALRKLAGHYAKMPTASRPRDEADAAVLALGEAIALKGLPDEGVPACATCHGPGAAAVAGAPENPLYPDLGGQHAAYLKQQLELWQGGKRHGTPFADIMTAAAKPLTPDQIDAVSRYYATLPAAGARAP